MSQRKYSEGHLTRLLGVDESVLTPSQKATLTRSRTLGTSFYGLLPQVFPVHYKAFQNMHDNAIRRNNHVSSAFSRTGRGFMNFIMSIGSHLTKKNPILVRKSHRRGFVRGNIEWISETHARAVIGERNAS
jgi:hypothetical protein